jgi:predicted ribosome quality control (RQC) complex YloA/Tae2 family protein
MLNNYFTIRKIAEYLNKNISGYFIKEIYTQEKNKLLMELSNEANLSKTLEYSIEREYNYLFLKNNFSKANKNTINLLKEVYSKQILEVDVYNQDRVICFRLRDDVMLLFTFFSNRSNCFLIHANEVIDSFKDKYENVNKSLEVIIPAKDNTIMKNDVNIPLKEYLKQNYRSYGKIYIGEALHRASLSENDIASEINVERLKNEFLKIKAEFDENNFLLYIKSDKIYISLIRLNLFRDWEIRLFEDINTLIGEYIRLKYRGEKMDLLRVKTTHQLSEKFENIKKKIAGLSSQILRADDSHILKMKGELILQNLALISKGDKVFIHQSNDDNIVDIKLKESLSPSENAQNYFDKYKKQKGSVSLLKMKLQKLKTEEAALKNELDRINEMDYKHLVKEEKMHKEIKDDETSMFRKFKLKDNFEVWVGKNSVSNDILTTQYTSQNDLWFHVRGASGSHTVLKLNSRKEDIGKEIIIMAASIAAYYSKARNSSSVPVAYCEKKYVKKKKGFKAGTVIMEREKVIFVKPALPAF